MLAYDIAFCEKVSSYSPRGRPLQVQVFEGVPLSPTRVSFRVAVLLSAMS